MRFKQILHESDVVVFLTLSDWKAEPPSNRKHYASRFLRTHSVIFVELPKYSDTRIREEIVGDNLKPITLYSPSVYHSWAQILVDLKSYLDSRGYSAPLLWIYNANYEQFRSIFPSATAVFHATEDYFSIETFPSASRLRNSLIGIIERVNLIIYCSPGVRNSYRRFVSVENEIVLPNGVDLDHYYPRDDAGGSPQFDVIYQGNINDRLDFPLLGQIISRMPDVKFLFLGPIGSTSAGWSSIANSTNVTLASEASPNKVREWIQDAKIGIVPFRQTPYILNSALPLKYFEYLACGLDVVSVPMLSVLTYDSKMCAASNAEDFIYKISMFLGMTDNRKKQNQLRAKQMSYDLRFDELLRFSMNIGYQGTRIPTKGLLIVDSDSMHVPTMMDSIKEISLYYKSKLLITVNEKKSLKSIGINAFDFIIVHYSVRVNNCKNHHFLSKLLSEFKGVKILLTQDDYDSPRVTQEFVNRSGIQVHYHTVPEHLAHRVYPPEGSGAKIIHTMLPGYVTSEMRMRSEFVPLEIREFDVVYRGRTLPPWYGRLGSQKAKIGKYFVSALEKSGLKYDISSDEMKRVYSGWLEFLSAGRCTLITESGSSIIDDQGLLQEAVLSSIDGKVDSSYGIGQEKPLKELLEAHELEDPWNCISPKVFEAISTGTVLIGVRGYYSGVIKENIHYISLEHDFSNISEVIEGIKSMRTLYEYQERAYREIILDPNLSYSHFLDNFDREIVKLLEEMNRTKLDRKDVSLKFIDDKRIELQIQQEDKINMIRQRFWIIENSGVFVLFGRKTELKSNHLSSTHINLFKRINLRTMRFQVFVMLYKIAPSRYLINRLATRSLRMAKFIYSVR